MKCGGDVLRDRRGALKSHLMCKGWMTPGEMKTSLLERASENERSWTALSVILDNLDLRFKEGGRYPYFMFIPK
jgi:hypothetical protein